MRGKPMGRGEHRLTTKLIEAAIYILTAEWPMTIRQLFYRLVSTPDPEGGTLMQNTFYEYKKVSRIMTTARNDERCSFDYIVDRSRPGYTGFVFDNPELYLKTMTGIYHKNYWEMQPVYIEVWSEKDSVIGSIEGLCRELGVSLYPSRGYNSTTKVHEAVERLKAVVTGKRIIIFYVGDCDGSGIDMDRDLQKRLLAYGAPPFTFIRLGIFKTDIEQFNLPPFLAKPDDPRTAKFIEEYGDGCVELDALPPTELRRRIREAVEAEMDMDSWKRAIAVEEVEQKSISDFIATWPKPHHNGGIDDAT
jgi:hypothetical protein